MYLDIFAGILCVIVAVTGVWVWWLDHSEPSPDQTQHKEEQNEEL